MNPGPRGKRVLVVEDEADTRIFLTTLLESGGFDAVSTEWAAQGIETALAVGPDLIILDIMTAEEAGIQLYKRLKRDRRLQRVPVIMLSAIDRKTFLHYQRSQSMAPGRGIPEPEAYLEKPAEADELLRLAGNLTAAAGAGGSSNRVGREDKSTVTGVNAPLESRPQKTDRVGSSRTNRCGDRSRPQTRKQP